MYWPVKTSGARLTTERQAKTLIRLSLIRVFTWRTCWIVDFLTLWLICTLRKHAYSNILKILPSKNGNFSDKKSDKFHISAENIDCGYSLEPPR